jgi:predicted nucleic acid-binding protein
MIPKSITLPAKDKPILAAAIQAKANYLITGDIRHFGKYFSKTISGVTIYPPAYYFKEK